MNIFLTLDYELFFGKESGSVEKCMIEPTEKLLQIVKPFGVKLTFFVDAGYLVKLEEEKQKFSQLEKDYRLITTQIRELAKNNHAIELHIHPHWEGSYYDGENWVFNTDNYKLSSFSEKEIQEIVKKYNQTLTNISGKPAKSYRAGGWSAQPFENIANALKKEKIFIDSTVFPGGYYNSNHQSFDFRSIKPYTTQYRFNQKLDNLVKNGDFTEIPISSFKLSPLFFWKFIINKFKGNENHISFGDGVAISKSKKEVIKLLTKPSISVVSIDGFKAKFLSKAFKKYQKNTSDKGNFVVIGHPKAFSEYSLNETQKFIRSIYKDHRFKTFQEV